MRRSKWGIAGVEIVLARDSQCRGHATLENIAPLRCPIFLRASLSLPSHPPFYHTTDNRFTLGVSLSGKVEEERGFIRDWKYPRAYGMHYRSSRFGFRLKKEGVGAKIVLGWKGDSFYTRWTSIRVCKHIYVYIYIYYNY